MTNKLNILTLKFGTKYGPEYVNNLYSGLQTNSNTPFNFYCYTDDPQGLDENINIIPIDPQDLETYMGHWIKIKFHESGFLPVGSKCLILDIDWVVLNDLDDVLEYDLKPNEFLTAYRWWSNTRETCPMNGGFQMFYNGDTNHIWERYNKEPKYWESFYYKRGDVSIYGMGEQNFIWDNLQIKLNFLPKEYFGRFSSDSGIMEMIQYNWLDQISHFDPYFVDNVISDKVKMVHFTSDFDNDDNDNCISNHDWIQHAWKNDGL